MQTTVTFKQIDPSSSLKSYVQKKLEKFDKMLESPAEAYVVLSVEKIRHIAEITLVCDKVKIHAAEESESMYSSIDALMDKIRIQIKKNKEKIKRHMSGKKQSIKNEPADEIPLGPDPVKDIPDYQIVMESIDYKPMDIEDAVVELNSGKQPFFVFNNARTERVNVLYKHNNGKLGLIRAQRIIHSMKISQLLDKKAIIADLGASDKKGAIDELSVAVATTTAASAKDIAMVLMEREQLGSTGIGGGIAIPHGKLDAVKSIRIGFGLSRKGVEYDSLDNKPVHLFFLLLTPENSAGGHLKVLAQISKMLKMDQFKKKLMAAESVDAIYDIIIEQDEDF